MTKKDKIQKINYLLQHSQLNLPSYRKQITKSGKNISWLNKHITFQNDNVPDELLELLKTFYEK
jgi:hypothetical protein